MSKTRGELLPSRFCSCKRAAFGGCSRTSLTAKSYTKSHIEAYSRVTGLAADDLRPLFTKRGGRDITCNVMCVMPGREAVREHLALWLPGCTAETTRAAAELSIKIKGGVPTALTSAWLKDVFMKGAPRDGAAPAAAPAASTASAPAKRSRKADPFLKKAEHILWSVKAVVSMSEQRLTMGEALVSVGRNEYHRQHFHPGAFAARKDAASPSRLRPTTVVGMGADGVRSVAQIQLGATARLRTAPFCYPPTPLEMQGLPPSGAVRDSAYTSVDSWVQSLVAPGATGNTRATADGDAAGREPGCRGVGLEWLTRTKAGAAASAETTSVWHKRVHLARSDHAAVEHCYAVSGATPPPGAVGVMLPKAAPAATPVPDTTTWSSQQLRRHCLDHGIKVQGSKIVDYQARIREVCRHAPGRAAQATRLAAALDLLRVGFFFVNNARAWCFL